MDDPEDRQVVYDSMATSVWGGEYQSFDVLGADLRLTDLRRYDAGCHGPRRRNRRRPPERKGR